MALNAIAAMMPIFFTVFGLIVVLNCSPKKQGI